VVSLLIFVNTFLARSEIFSARGFILGVLVQSQAGDIRGDPPGGDVSWDTVIVEAVVAGDIDKVRSLLTRGNGPNATHKSGGSALRWAAYFGRKEIAKLLVSSGADLNIEKGGELGKALICAVIQGDERLVADLVSKGADVNSVAQVGETTLHWACIMAHKDLVKLLVQKGASINAVSRGGCTLLVSAVIGGDPDIVRFLIQKGTGPVHPSRWEFALASGEVLKILESQRSILEARQWPESSESISGTNNPKKPADSPAVPGEGLLWKVKLGSGSLYRPVLADGTVYVVMTEEHHGVSHSYLLGVDVLTGKRRVRIKIALRNVWDTTIRDGIAYFGGLDGTTSAYHACALDLRTGAERWKYKTKGQVVSIPSISGGVVYFGCFGGCIYAVDQVTGKEKWKYEVPRSFPDSGSCYVSPPTLANGTIFFGTGHLYDPSKPGYIVALDAGSGREKWRLKTWTKPSVYPNVGETVHAACQGGEILALNPADGAVLWRFNAKSKLPNLAYASIIHVGQNRVYVETSHGYPGAYTRDARVIALDSKTGTELFRVRTDTESLSFQCQSNPDRLYMTGADGWIYVLNAERGDAVQKILYGGKYATVVSEAALCVDSQGTLYALNLNKSPKIKVSQ